MHSDITFIPDLEQDFGLSFNNIDEDIYAVKAEELMKDGRITDFKIGEWYFSHPNKLEVNFTSGDDVNRYSLTFDFEANAVDVSSQSGDQNMPMRLTFAEGEDPKVEIV